MNRFLITFSFSGTHHETARRYRNELEINTVDLYDFAFGNNTYLHLYGFDQTPITITIRISGLHTIIIGSILFSGNIC